MEQTFTAPAGRYTGPVFATITAPTADVRVKVDRTARVASVTISTTAPADSPAAEAVRAATITQDGQELTVDVPEFQAVTVAAGPVIRGAGTSVTFASGHGSVYVGGVLQTTTGTTAGVEVLVTLPAGSTVYADTVSGSVRVLGPAALVYAQTASGDVNVAEAARMTAFTLSGDVRGGVITERFEAETASGHVRVTDHEGRSCRIRTQSGDVAVEAHEARGLLAVSTASGDVTLRGARHLDVEVRSLSGTVRR